MFQLYFRGRRDPFTSLKRHYRRICWRVQYQGGCEAMLRSLGETVLRPFLFLLFFFSGLVIVMFETSTRSRLTFIHKPELYTARGLGHSLNSLFHLELSIHSTTHSPSSISKKKAMALNLRILVSLLVVFGTAVASPWEAYRRGSVPSVQYSIPPCRRGLKRA